MLVYAKNPRGILYLEKFRIHGIETGYNPCDIPFDLYKVARNDLVDATYREDYLSKLFGKEFPMVAFTYSELRYVPDKTLDNIGPLMVYEYDPKWSHKKKVDQIKRSLTLVSPSS
jgi:hypothetical protein